MRSYSLREPFFPMHVIIFITMQLIRIDGLIDAFVSKLRFGGIA